MPSRNSLKEFGPDQYYHLYNRGIDKRTIFKDDQDYSVFLGLMKKFLSPDHPNKSGRHKPAYLGGKMKLLAYCLMPNHFHLLVYQSDETAVTEFMRRVMTGYAMYFNARYDRKGALFEGRYKASAINKDSYLHHISRYIHQNPEDYEHWPYSSLPYYQGKKDAKWIDVMPILSLFHYDIHEYQTFLRDYQDSKAELSLLKWQLANGSELAST